MEIRARRPRTRARIDRRRNRRALGAASDRRELARGQQPREIRMAFQERHVPGRLALSHGDFRDRRPRLRASVRREDELHAARFDRSRQRDRMLAQVLRQRGRHGFLESLGGTLHRGPHFDARREGARERLVADGIVGLLSERDRDAAARARCRDR